MKNGRNENKNVGTAYVLRAKSTTRIIKLSVAKKYTITTFDKPAEKRELVDINSILKGSL